MTLQLRSGSISDAAKCNQASPFQGPAIAAVAAFHLQATAEASEIANGADADLVQQGLQNQLVDGVVLGGQHADVEPRRRDGLGRGGGCALHELGHRR